MILALLALALLAGCDVSGYRVKVDPDDTWGAGSDSTATPDSVLALPDGGVLAVDGSLAFPVR